MVLCYFVAEYCCLLWSRFCHTKLVAQFYEPDFTLPVSRAVAEHLWCCTWDQQVAGSNPSPLAVECNPRQVVKTRAFVTKHYNLVPATGQWCFVSGKVTVGLASHWPRVTDISGSPPYGLKAYDSTRLCSLVEYTELCLYLICTMIPARSRGEMFETKTTSVS